MPWRLENDARFTARSLGVALVAIYDEAAHEAPDDKTLAALKGLQAIDLPPSFFIPP